MTRVRIFTVFLIALVAGGGLAARSLLAKSGTPRPGASSAPAHKTSADSYTGVPPYYVAVANSSLTVVRATWTGATLARITTSIACQVACRSLPSGLTAPRPVTTTRTLPLPSLIPRL